MLNNCSFDLHSLPADYLEVMQNIFFTLFFRILVFIGRLMWFVLMNIWPSDIFPRLIGFRLWIISRCIHIINIFFTQNKEVGNGDFNICFKLSIIFSNWVCIIQTLLFIKKTIFISWAQQKVTISNFRFWSQFINCYNHTKIIKNITFFNIRKLLQK